MLTTKKVEFNTQKFSVREIAIGKMLPILPRLQGDPEEQQEAQIELMSVCVLNEKGEPLGHTVLELGLASYMFLAKEVMAVNGLDAGKEAEEG